MVCIMPQTDETMGRRAGVFVELDAYYLAITFLEPGALPGELSRHTVPLDLQGRHLALPSHGREVVEYKKPRNVPVMENWD